MNIKLGQILNHNYEIQQYCARVVAYLFVYEI